MERVGAIWEEPGLPQLAPQVPWHGYSLGQWDDELAARGDHSQTG